ncbi:MAG: enoyl-CoA hydratase/isomerase family protein, partial [Candidatus Helarchaeota archaeon]
MAQNLTLEKKGKLGIIIINRPEVKNAINEQTLLELRSAIREFRNNKRIRAIMITGIKDSFSAGMDLKSVQGLSTEKVNWITALGRTVLFEIFSGMKIEVDPIDFFEDSENVHINKLEIGHNWKPVIAAINGYALGGGLELACACDFRVASRRAILGFPEVNLGIFPAWGGTQLSTKLLGMPISKYLIFTGSRITADHAFNIGLLHEIYEEEEFFDKSIEFGKRISSKNIDLLRN